MDRTPFMQAVKEAKSELEVVRQRISELRRLEAKAQKLEEFLSVAQDVLRYDAPELIDRGAPNLVSPELSEDSLWKVIQMVMGVHGKPMDAGEVLDSLLKQDFQVHGEHKKETVRSAMVRKMDIFERVGRGMFALKDWPEDIKTSRAKGESVLDFAMEVTGDRPQ